METNPPSKALADELRRDLLARLAALDELALFALMEDKATMLVGNDLAARYESIVSRTTIPPVALRVVVEKAIRDVIDAHIRDLTATAYGSK